jgi:transposase-like protein
MDIPYCPNPDCKYHKKIKVGMHFWKKGFDHLKNGEKQQRYQCCYCGRTFNLNYFSIDYYVKLKIDFQEIQEMQYTCSGIRDMARKLKCSPKVIINREARYARHIMSITAQELKDLVLQENLCADGLESFVLSQYFPNNINILTGKKSQFLYDNNYFYMRRKGRVTEKQKLHKEELYKIANLPKGATSNSFRELLDSMVRLMDSSSKKSFILDTDENPTYKKQIEKHPQLKNQKNFYHRTTNSKEERNTSNKLFPCNYIDKLIRKCLAEHTRETMQFSRSSNNTMSRFMIFQFHHNFIKEFRVNKKVSQPHITHGEKAGISREAVNRIIQRVYSGFRDSYDRVEEFLNPFQRRLWKNELPNPLKVASISNC